MVSTADQLRAEGRREMLMQQLEAKFGSIDSTIRARVEQAPDKQVVEWARRILVVDAIEEVFAQ